jgi:hypothetical protein
LVAVHKPSIRRSITRVVCGLLALLGCIGIVALCAKAYISGEAPDRVEMLTLLAGLPAFYIFGRYAYLGHG